MISQSNLTNTDAEKSMPLPDIYQSLTLTEIKGCYHISLVTPDDIWISDSESNLSLTTTVGDVLHCEDDFQERNISHQGLHAVNNHENLLFADMFDDNNKSASDLETISSVTPDEIKISKSKNSLLLKNKVGEVLHYVEDFYDRINLKQGLHAVNNHGELFYVDKFDNIKKLSSDLETITTFIWKTHSDEHPWCLYWSPFSGDLLVTFWMMPWACKVARYNQTGQLIHTTQFDNTGQEIYLRPGYITENTNGDVVVSDVSAVVVTDYGGSYRFSYTGHPHETGVEPLGICTNELSHILLCDHKTNSVHIINKNGQFLLNLPSQQNGIKTPSCLSYDINTHSLWVGSHSNNVIYVYRYKEQDIISGMFILKKILYQLLRNRALFILFLNKFYE